MVDDLYLESLTDGAPAATYIDMMKHNVTRIVDGLVRLMGIYDWLMVTLLKIIVE